MTRLIVLSAATLALAAANVHAEGCNYGQKGSMANAHNAVDEPIAEDGMSPELLALLKKQEEQALQDALIVPNVPN